MLAEEIHTIRLNENDYIQRNGKHGWLIFTKRSMSILNQDFNFLGSFLFPKNLQGLHMVSRDLKSAIFSLRDKIVLATPGGKTIWEFEHLAWQDWQEGSCFLNNSGTLVWATIPGLQNQGDKWCVLDASNGKLLAEVELGCLANGSSMFAVDDTQMAMDIGEGQEGSSIYWGKYSNKNNELLVSKENSSDRILTDILQEKHEFITAPHNYGRFAIHTLNKTRDYKESPAMGLEYEENFYAGYLTENKIIANFINKKTEDYLHAIFCAKNFELIDKIQYPRETAADIMQTIGNGRWVTYTKDALTLWKLKKQV